MYMPQNKWSINGYKMQLFVIILKIVLSKKDLPSSIFEFLRIAYFMTISFITNK